MGRSTQEEEKVWGRWPQHQIARTEHVRHLLLLWSATQDFYLKTNKYQEIFCMQTFSKYTHIVKSGEPFERLPFVENKIFL